ncbi:MAG: DNA ligase D [Alphaproteobacteria bacterium]
MHEIKYDGYRTLARIDGRDIRLITRNGHDWTKRYGALADAFKELSCKTALIDGEVVVQDAKGASKINLLESALSEGRSHDFTFFAFDLLHLDGYDLSAVPLEARKKTLKALIDPHVHARSAIQYSDHMEGDGAALFARACRIGLEGVVSKKRNARYSPGRSTSWVKIKRQHVGSFAVVGFTTNAPRHIAALVLAERGTALRYCGKVGSGFSEAAARDLYAQLSKVAVARPSIVVPDMPGAIWIDPGRFDAEVTYRDVTPTGALRHASYISLSQHKGAVMKRRLLKDSDLAAIHLTNPDREMFEGSGATKLDIALYYARVADWMLPDLFNRPVSLIRCPTGKLEDCFYQRHAFAGLPPGVATIDIKEEEGRNAYVYIKDAKGFLGLSQFGVVEFHPWACRIDEPEKPDRLIIDLDPAPDVPWAHVLRGAEIVRERVNALGLSPFVRTTGGKGIHVVVPLVRRHAWAAHKSFSQGVARALARDEPRLFTASPVKADRKGRIFLDYGRNFRGSTAVASFSLRARAALTVATPVAWEELSGIVGPEAFDRRTVPERLAQLTKDPWADFDTAAAAITQKARRDVGLKE